MDLISREDAIDALEEHLDYLQKLNKAENPSAESKWYGVNWARNTIEELPSAESQVAIKDCRNCKHGGYNDHWGTCFCYNPNDCDDWNLWEPDKDLSAERVGHWYDKNEGIWNVGMVMACSNCGESFYEMPIICGEPTYNYCPNCGAKMAKGEEE